MRRTGPVHGLAASAVVGLRAIELEIGAQWAKKLG